MLISEGKSETKAVCECVRTWLWTLCGLLHSPGLLRA